MIFKHVEKSVGIHNTETKCHAATQNSLSSVCYPSMLNVKPLIFQPPDVMVVKERDESSGPPPLSSLVNKLMGCFHHQEQVSESTTTN